jgi:hypothetical protein
MVTAIFLLSLLSGTIADHFLLFIANSYQDTKPKPAMIKKSVKKPKLPEISFG